MDTDGCSNVCRSAQYGDGIVQSDEECDLGDANGEKKSVALPAALPQRGLWGRLCSRG